MSRGIRKICAVAAVLSCAAATLSACTGVPGSDRRTPRAAVSREEAERVLNEFVKRANEVRKVRDQDALARFAAGPQLPIDIGKFKMADYHRKARDFRLAPLEYERPAFFVPRLTRYPKWFSALVAPSGGGPNQALLFTRANPDDAWKITYSTVLGPGGRPGEDGGDGAEDGKSPLPRIALDDDGLATAVPADGDGRASIRPIQLPDAHASLNQYGAGGFGNGALGAGLWTTAVADTVGQDVRQAKRKGFTYSRSYHASGFPVYALRTEDGGAVVWYAVTDELSVARARARPRSALRMAADMAGIIRRPQVIDAFQVSSLNQYVAVVPPRGGRAEVVGSYGGPVGGVGR